MRKYITEFIGTFFLVLTIVLSAQSNFTPSASLAIGAVLAALIYTGYSISGAHFNPAISITIHLLKRMERTEFIAYCTAQLLGGVLAAFLGGFLLNSIGTPEPLPPALKIIPALIVEFLGTFLLIVVYIKVILLPSPNPPVYYGLAIGLLVIALLFIFKPISGAALNPAAAVSLSAFGILAWKNIWIYIIANFGAAVMASFLFKWGDISTFK